MPTSGELARRLLEEDGPVYGFYPHLNPRVPGKPDTLNTPEHRGAVAEALLGMAPGSGEALSARDAWGASGRAGDALMQGRFGDAAKGYGDMALGVLGAIPAAGYIARGTKRGAEWMDRNVPEWVNRLLDAAAPKGAQDTLYAIPAWHGSPHSFDKFDMSKLGTGEGAQAYGHGLYFAESPDVAKSYRDALSPMLVNGEPADDIMLGTYARAKMGGYLDDFRQPKLDRIASLEAAKLSAAGEPHKLATIDEMLETARADLAMMDRVKDAEVGRSGVLYNVELDVEPEDLLDWDKPLSEQGEIGERALAVFEKMGVAQSGRWKPDTLADIKQLADENYGHDSFAAASKALREAGVPGIRYLDQFSRGADGTSNYVIFDDQLVKILGRE